MSKAFKAAIADTFKSSDGKSADRIVELEKRLAKAEADAKASASRAAGLTSALHERDRYRATAMSLAHRNKLLEAELTTVRKSDHGKQEQYIDVRLQVQELRDALARRSAEIEELQAARDHLPTSDVELLASYKRMRDVFESLRSTLSCPLCYEIFKPNDVLTLECGHTMCHKCLTEWSTTKFRLYNLATTPDCPECRAPGRHFVKVYMLEEAVRVVDRLERLEVEYESQKRAGLDASVPPLPERDQPSGSVVERDRHRYDGLSAETTDLRLD